MRRKISTSEVKEFLEYLLSHQEATNVEMELYELFIWDDLNKLNEYKYTYRNLKKKLRKYYNEGV
ncbi:hypothetical protein [Robertmurraya siralis]|uniref:hypothetical protein n=1 Tax=Robertmurraya siralis TaxID=77777 RepID=UPI0010F85CFC|nr:hypothetical protein [Robertmurraya siralis]